MAKAILTHKGASLFDDLPEERYHFPRTYLRQVEAAAGDLILYYEPRRAGEGEGVGGRQAYFAAARIVNVREDPKTADHFYADIDNYLPFARPVSFVERGGYYESGLRKQDGSTNKGQFGRAVRLIPDREYEAILSAGFAAITHDELRDADVEDAHPPIGFSEAEQSPFELEDETPRRISDQLVARPFRERAFSKAIKTLYNDTCAVTGLQLINGGGRSEVQAAHIKPAASHGPDSVRNGLALSGTVHWMFDRGLLSFSDDLQLLMAKDKVPEPMLRLLPSDGRMLAPANKELRPHPRFLGFHREHVFKG